MIRYLAMGVLSWCAVAPALAGSAALHSGQYEGLMLAVTPGHQVEGFYQESMGEGVARGCTFYLQGKPEALTTWRDAAYPGSVAAAPDGVTLTVEQGRQHPGCINVLMPEIAAVRAPLHVRIGRSRRPLGRERRHRCSREHSRKDGLRGHRRLLRSPRQYTLTSEKPMYVTMVGSEPRH